VAWLARRDEDDRRQTEAEDEAARVDACFANPDLYEFMLPASGKWIKWPCSSCNDGVMSGDEVDVDCGGSCDMCLVQPEPEPEAWRPPEEECNEPEGLLEGSERTCENGDGNNTESAFLHVCRLNTPLP
jgi:hypothetical protein